MNKISVSGIELAYTRRGRGTPLVLIHGYPLDHQIWDSVASLLENEFDLILPDLRGFGISTTVTSQYTVTDMADDLANLLDHLEVKQTALAGHSMGGYVALAFAKKYPEKTNGLALVSSQALADTPDRKEGRYKTAEEVAVKGVDMVAEAMAPKLSPDGGVQAYARDLILKQGKDGLIGALKAMAEREDSTALFGSVSYPVVLIHGDADALIPVDRAREIKSALAGAHLVELPGVGHMPMMEAPEKTADALKQLK